MNLPLRTGEATQRLRHAVTAYAPATLASSFGVEDMVILDLAATLDLPVEVFTLDTGRLHDETYAFIDSVRQRYGVPVRLYAPDARDIESFVAAHGPNPFYRSVELRRQCCELRKVRPLARALAGKSSLDHRPAPRPVGHAHRYAHPRPRRATRPHEALAAGRLDRG